MFGWSLKIVHHHRTNKEDPSRAYGQLGKYHEFCTPAMPICFHCIILIVTWKNVFCYRGEHTMHVPTRS